MINCYSLFSFRFLCFARLPEKSQHLHLVLIKTLLMLIDSYVVNLLPRVSCYMATWFNSLLSAAHLRFRADTCTKAPHRGNCNFQTHANIESSTTEVSEFHQTSAQVTTTVTRLTAKVHRGKSPAGHRNHPGPGSVGLWGVSGHRASVKPGVMDREQREQKQGAGGWVVQGRQHRLKTPWAEGKDAAKRPSKN